MFYHYFAIWFWLLSQVILSFSLFVFDFETAWHDIIIECVPCFCPRRCWLRKPVMYFLLFPATRETSFVHAISAAGVMYTLTRNCSLGDLDNCGCDVSKNGKIGEVDCKILVITSYCDLLRRLNLLMWFLMYMHLNVWYLRAKVGFINGYFVCRWTWLVMGWLQR